MIENLTGIAYGLVVFAILVGVGLVVLTNFGNSVGGTANTTLQTIIGYLGTSSGGLVTWLPAVIALIIGVLFIGMLMGKGKKY
jgi:hypothetical protein